MIFGVILQVRRSYCTLSSLFALYRSFNDTGLQATLNIPNFRILVLTINWLRTGPANLLHEQNIWSGATILNGRDPLTIKTVSYYCLRWSIDFVSFLILLVHYLDMFPFFNINRLANPAFRASKERVHLVPCHTILKSTLLDLLTLIRRFQGHTATLSIKHWAVIRDISSSMLINYLLPALVRVKCLSSAPSIDCFFLFLDVIYLGGLLSWGGFLSTVFASGRVIYIKFFLWSFFVNFIIGTTTIPILCDLLLLRKLNASQIVKSLVIIVVLGTLLKGS